MTDHNGVTSGENERQRHELAIMKRLNELSIRPVSHDNLAEVTGEILETAISLTSASMGNLHLYDEASGGLMVAASRGFRPEAVADLRRIRGGKVACGTALARRQRVIVEDISQSPLFAGTAIGELLLAAGARAIQSTPLISRSGRLVGVLSTHYKSPSRADDMELAVLDLLAGQAADIIEHVKIQQALKASEEKFRLLFAAMNEGFALMEMVYDESGDIADVRVLEANTVFEKQAGQLPATGVGKHLPDFLLAFSPLKLKKYGQVARTGRPLSFEEYSALSGSWFLVNAYSPAPGKVAATFTDITGRKRLESELAEHRENLRRLVEQRTAELKRSEQEYRTLVANIPMVLYRFDRDLRLIYASPAFETVFGRKVEEQLGKTWQERGFSEEYWQQREKVYREVFRSGCGSEFEAVLPTASGENGHFHIQVIPEKDENGQVQTALAIVQDITEKKKYEAELLRLDRLNTVGEIAASIGHEVRNPLTTVRGYLQMFQRKAESADYREQFTTMIEELDRANAIISDFLSLAKNKVVKFRRYNLNDVISALLPLLQAEALRTGHRIEVDMGEVPDIDMDEKEIRQLLLNLARNGFEAMEAGGRLTIASSSYADSGRVVLSVSDTGRGIPQALLEKLGTPFMTTKENGTGLGLPVSYRIAQRHGAKIAVKTSSQGTTFMVIFAT